jgi:hypothetical protein
MTKQESSSFYWTRSKEKGTGQKIKRTRVDLCVSFTVVLSHFFDSVQQRLELQNARSFSHRVGFNDDIYIFNFKSLPLLETRECKSGLEDQLVDFLVYTFL